MSFPKVISIYKKDTGMITQVLSVTQESDIVISDDFGYVDGNYKSGEFKVVNNKVVSHTPDYVSGTNAIAVRDRRNKLLQVSDWTQMPDSPLSESKKTEWATYRQQLRDMMSSYTDNENNTVDNTTFPTSPE